MLSPDETGFSGIRFVDSWLAQNALPVSEKQFLPIAHAYTSSLEWMSRRTGYWHGLTVLGLVGVFLYRIAPAKPEIPEYNWIVVGPRWPHAELDKAGIDQNDIRNQFYAGLPHAYIWTGHPGFTERDDAPNPACALDSYVGVIGGWVSAVQSGGDLSELFPVGVPSGKTALEYANDIAPLLKKIDDEVLPRYADDLKAAPHRR